MKKILCAMLGLALLLGILSPAVASESQPEITYVQEWGYMVGTGSGFQADMPVTRAMICQVVYNLAGRPEVNQTDIFENVSGNEWYAAAASWAKENQLISGDVFPGAEPISGAELMTILAKYANSIGKTIPDEATITGSSVTRRQLAQLLLVCSPWREYDVEATAAAIYVSPYEWGPGVSKMIVTLPDAVSNIDTNRIAVTTAGSKRTVSNIYLSDREGNAVESDSVYVTLELKTTQNDCGNPFTYNLETSMNDWSAQYIVTASFFAEINGKKQIVLCSQDCAGNRICPSSEQFDVRGEFSGIYKNPMSEEDEQLTLRYAAYHPDQLEQDNVCNPLIIWLHGQGEGGVNPDIALLGNEVTALAGDSIQAHFTSNGGNDGAYILVVQCPTYWMDGGDGQQSNGDVVSRYTKILMDTIQTYVDENPDVDQNRIYLGGCSNGGYMTMNMLVSYPNFWAAAYPVCEGYAYGLPARNENNNYILEEGAVTPTQVVLTNDLWMTEEKINAIRDVPIWFVQSENDPMAIASRYVLPTYRALLNAGSQNCWLSYFESVIGTDDPNNQYFGHFSWIYLFNDQVTGVQNQNAVKESDNADIFGVIANNQGGGNMPAKIGGNSYTNIFDWMNAQSKNK